MHTSHAGKHVQRTGWHTPHTAPRVCAQPGTPLMPALPSGFNPWGRQMYKSRHSSTESLGCPHTSGDKHVPPKSCILLMCMDHFPPASIHGKEKAPAFPESRMCCLVCFSQPSCFMSNVRFLEPDLFEEAHQVLGTTSPREMTQEAACARNFWKNSQHLPLLLSSLPEHTCQPCELARTQAERQVHR